jgi:hypothetical protein
MCSNRRRRVPLRATLLVLLSPLGAAEAQDAVSDLPLFTDQTPLEIRITAPIRQLTRDGEDRPEHAAVVEFVDTSGQRVQLDVDIRIRGKSRLVVCDFPPLRIDFPRAAVAGTVFADQNQLKLVTLCSRTATHRDYLAQEYQIYRLFNELTNRSFRVRWAMVEYVDTDARRPESFTEPAFFIEADWELAARNGLQLVELPSLRMASLDPQHTALLALFHYMIGMTDWEAVLGPPGESCCHNGKVIGSESGANYVVPYDFDQAGLINTEYAVPAEQLRIRSVAQRVYRGFCVHSPELEAAIDLLNENHEAMIRVLDDEPAGNRARVKSLAYLEESFELINDSRKREDDIVRRCRD